jgi:hypothetical protein
MVKIHRENTKTNKVMSENTEPKPVLDGHWAKIELMGHMCVVGQTTEVSIAGKGMLRVDIPDKDGLTSHTRFYSPDAVYCITPVDRQIALALAIARDSRPVTLYDLKKLAADHKLGDEDRSPEEE